MRGGVAIRGSSMWNSEPWLTTEVHQMSPPNAVMVFLHIASPMP